MYRVEPERLISRSKGYFCWKVVVRAHRQTQLYETKQHKIFSVRWKDDWSPASST